jgi:hypothetical protein
VSRVTEMFAFVVADRGPSDEGIPAVSIGGLPYPLIGADMARCESYYGYAEDIANNLARRVELRVWDKAGSARVIKSWGSNPAPCDSSFGGWDCDLWAHHAGEHEYHHEDIVPHGKPHTTWP